MKISLSFLWAVPSDSVSDVAYQAEVEKMEREIKCDYHWISSFQSRNVYYFFNYFKETCILEKYHFNMIFLVKILSYRCIIKAKLIFNTKCICCSFSAKSIVIFSSQLFIVYKIISPYFNRLCMIHVRPSKKNNQQYIVYSRLKFYSLFM